MYARIKCHKYGCIKRTTTLSSVLTESSEMSHIIQPIKAKKKRFFLDVGYLVQSRTNGTKAGVLN